jgi:hypothetical protein
VLGPIGQVEEALNFIGRNGSAVDSAVLDLNLHGIPSYPIADALVEQGIRFVFAIGYDFGTIHEAYRGYPHCGKPFQEDTLLAALRHPAA